MESIGQLTGGVAHDFNNLLAVVLGSLSLLKKAVPDEPRISRLPDRAIQGAERGATLTTCLLAFARRQELKVEFVALQKLIPEMLDFLRHSVGPNIVVHVEISPEVYAVEVDANQLELALINLAVNARDAMPQGGSLTIACHNEGVGKKIGSQDAFVCITVTDTGEGMSEATLARAQEPFFTTKGVGKGTGLPVDGAGIYGAIRWFSADQKPTRQRNFGNDLAAPRERGRQDIGRRNPGGATERGAKSSRIAGR